MQKVFRTQLQGVFDEITNKEDEQIEDAARLLAQAIISDGTIYVWGVGAGKAVINEATAGPNQLPSARALADEDIQSSVSTIDRALVVAPHNEDPMTISIVKQLKEQGAEVVGISCSGKSENEHELLSDCVDIYIDTHAGRPLVPMENGEKKGWPTTTAILYVYQLIHLSVLEMLSEQGFDD